MKRIIVALVLLGAAAGGAGVAWAHPGDGDRAARREAVRSCVQEARQANPDADKEARRAEVRACLEAKGISPRPLTPERRARRAEFRECVQKARAEHPDADKATLRQAVRECVTDS